MSSVDTDKSGEYLILIELLHRISAEEDLETDAISRLSMPAFAEDWDSEEDAVYDSL